MVMAVSHRDNVMYTKAKTASTLPVSKLVANAGLSLLNTEGISAIINKVVPVVNT